jgi:pimeloyl-ACP methyl ester carboxylesterase
MTRTIKIILVVLTLCMTQQHFGFNHSNTTTASKAFTVTKSGQGDPMLFLPGFTTPGSIWNDTIDALKLNKTTYTFSYAGFNGNAPIEMPWYDTVKHEIINYIKSNQLQNIILVGHSMGGNLAIDITLAFPNEVSKLIIVDSLPNMKAIMLPNVPVEQLVYDSPYNQQMLNMNAEQFKGMANMMASNMTNTTNKVSTLAQWILEADRKTYVYGYTDLLKLDQTKILSNIKTKTLILGASFPSVDIVKANFEKQYALLDNKTIEMASNSKHFIMFDQAEWFYSKVSTFIANEN